MTVNTVSTDSRIEDMIRELGKDGKAWEFYWDWETDQFAVVAPDDIIAGKEKTFVEALTVAMEYKEKHSKP